MTASHPPASHSQDEAEAEAKLMAALKRGEIIRLCDNTYIAAPGVADMTAGQFHLDDDDEPWAGWSVSHSH